MGMQRHTCIVKAIASFSMFTLRTSKSA